LLVASSTQAGQNKFAYRLYPKLLIHLSSHRRLWQESILYQMAL
jgi:hypothetical protein